MFQYYVLDSACFRLLRLAPMSHTFDTDEDEDDKPIRRREME